MSGGREFRELVTPAAAAAAIAELAPPPRIEFVPLTEAGGRVLAERIDASIDVPGFDRASMDGYAVRASDTFGADEADPVVLSVGGSVHAGTTPAIALDEGTAVEISTGAVLPPGADAVVMVERTDPVGDDRVAIRTSVAPGDHVMAAGADIAAGERALGPGTQISAREVGLLSALGIESVPVRQRPTVGIISTGDELVRPGEPIEHGRGQIYDVNSHTIATAAAEAGAEPVLYPHVGDDYDAMEEMLRRAADECDLVLSSGSTSASAVDVIYRVIENEGELVLHGVAIKPGKPMLVGRLDGSAYVGLPGYPVSALMIFRRFVVPVIEEAAGRPARATATIDGRMAVRARFEEGRTRLLPVGLVESGAGDILVYPVDKGSGATTSLVEADGIVEVDADTAFVDVGEDVTVELFSPEGKPPSMFGVGEDDPVVSRLLDRVTQPRYLGVGSREGLRRLERGEPDVVVVSGPVDLPTDIVGLGEWSREWGLIVAPENPADIGGIEDLVDRDLQFVNRPSNSGLRVTFDAALADVATSRDESVGDLRGAINGYGRTARAHESPARRVADGVVDVGLGLRSSADRLELDFVSCGWESVRAAAAPERAEKPGVVAFRTAIDNIETILANIPGTARR